MEHFDYIVNRQQDDLIDKKRLTVSFLEMFDKLGLAYTEGEKAMLD